jgi:hypothetical protein
VDACLETRVAHPMRSTLDIIEPSNAMKWSARNVSLMLAVAPAWLAKRSEAAARRRRAWAPLSMMSLACRGE